MSLGGLLAAGASFRRVSAPRHLGLALGVGLAAGLAVRGLPAPGLARPAFVALVAGLTGLLVIPVVAALPCGDRACGFEQLMGLRPISSLALGLGRVLGAVVGAALLALVLMLSARQVAAGRQVPLELVGLASASSAQAAEWRFALPQGSVGPFDLRVPVLVPMRRYGRLTLELRRGEARLELETKVRSGRLAIVVLPDLPGARGDLYVRLQASDGLVLGAQSPRLVAGRQPLGEAGLALPRVLTLRILLAALAAAAAASAFHFETALLAGLLALLAPIAEQPVTSLAMVVLLLAFAVLGTALVRRQALP